MSGLLQYLSLVPGAIWTLRRIALVMRWRPWWAGPWGNRYRQWAIDMGLIVAILVLIGVAVAFDPRGLPGYTTVIVIWSILAWIQWRERPPRNRRRIRKLIGEKSRAARARLVAAMPKPGPALKPAGGIA